jgi:hypothetical protein
MVKLFGIGKEGQGEPDLTGAVIEGVQDFLTAPGAIASKSSSLRGLPGIMPFSRLSKPLGALARGH